MRRGMIILMSACALGVAAMVVWRPSYLSASIVNAESASSANVGNAVASPAPRPGQPALPSNLQPTYPRSSIDYEVTYASWRGWGPKGGDRIVRFRHGSTVRTEINYIGSKRKDEPAHTTEYSNLATGAAISVLDENQAVSLWLPMGTDVSRGRHTLRLSGQVETIAGEQCKTWVAKPIGEGVRYSACIARDGVVLRETAHYSNNQILEEKRAIKVVRRFVAASEVMPSKQLLDWMHWAQAKTATPADAGREPKNYELVLAISSPTQRPDRRMRIMRAAGGWNYSENRDGSELGSMSISNDSVSLNFDHSAIARSLSIRFSSHQVFDNRPTWPSEHPMQRDDETILNERCTWYDEAPGMFDASFYACLTEDHLPLIQSEYDFWGGGTTRWQAETLERGKVPVSSILPPDWLMRWAYWGWSEVAEAHEPVVR
jgi:hypothetical protein